MSDKQINTLAKAIYIISSLMILTGALLKLNHYPNSFMILNTGFILGIAGGSFDAFRLKKKIKSLRNRLSKRMNKSSVPGVL